jgi:hypothetical protein
LDLRRKDEERKEICGKEWGKLWKERKTGSVREYFEESCAYYTMLSYK